MKLTNIKGRKICGKRGGRSFKDAIRPNLVDGKCPEGFEPCHPVEGKIEYLDTTTCIEIGQ